MDISYVITPFVAWFIAGSIKFIINSIRIRKFAFSLIGYGRMPSNHASIASSAVAIIAFKQGIERPAVVVAIALAFIVMLDAYSLRQQIGKQARIINKLTQNNTKKLTEIIGHTKLELFVGILVGMFSAWIVFIVGENFVGENYCF